MLGHRVVDGDHRERQRTIRCHRPQADHTRGGLFRAADHTREQLAALFMQRADQVGAIIHRHLGLVIQRGADMPVVGDIVFAFDCEGGDLVMRNQAGRHIILGGKRVGCGQNDICATQVERIHQVGRLGGHMQAGGDAHAFQRAFFGKTLADQAQDRHFSLGPIDPAPTTFSQLDVFYVIFFHEILHLM